MCYSLPLAWRKGLLPVRFLTKHPGAQIRQHTRGGMHGFVKYYNRHSIEAARNAKSDEFPRKRSEHLAGNEAFIIFAIIYM